MATLYHADGRTELLAPANGASWTLAELQAAVGGFIELMPGMPHRVRIIVNEEGKLRGLPVNKEATDRLHHIMAAQLVVAVADLPKEVGRRLRYLPVLVGDVLFLETTERL